MKMFALLLSLVTLLAATTTTTQADDSSIAQGSLGAAFSSWGKASLQGDWKIIKQGDKTYIELADNFKAKEGPDVKIFLSPTSASNVNGDNATHGSVLVTQISDFEGKSRIEIPSGTDLSQFQSLVFHCEAYSKLWGSSPLL